MKQLHLFVTTAKRLADEKIQHVKELAIAKLRPGRTEAVIKARRNTVKGRKDEFCTSAGAPFKRLDRCAFGRFATRIELGDCVCGNWHYFCISF